MASIAKLEDETVAGAVVIALVALGVLGYMAWKKISLPAWAYPSTLWGTISTGVDKALNDSGVGGGKVQGRIDAFLGSVFGWISSNLPNPSASKLGQGDGSPSVGISTGTGQGNQAEPVSVDDYEPGSSNGGN